MSRRSEKEDARLRRLYQSVKQRSQKGAKLDTIRGQGREVSRDYLASMIIGAGAKPLSVLAGRKLKRALHNKELRNAIRNTRNRSAKKRLRSQMQKGPAFGPSHLSYKASKKPLMTYSSTAGEGAQGAVMGSVIQMLRDRFSGSAGLGDLR